MEHPLCPCANREMKPFSTQILKYFIPFSSHFPKHERRHHQHETPSIHTDGVPGEKKSTGRDPRGIAGPDDTLLQPISYEENFSKETISWHKPRSRGSMPFLITKCFHTQFRLYVCIYIYIHIYISIYIYIYI